MDGLGGMMAAGGLVQRYAEGGEVMATRGVPQQVDANTIVQRAAAAIRGELSEPEAEQAVADLIETFGSGAYRQLRETVLQGVVPGAQTEGLIRGSGGGMDDQVMGMIGSQQPVAVSPGEFIIPADVVSGLGDGSTDAGAQRLDELIESVRMARTGTDEQPAPIRESMGGSV